MKNQVLFSSKDKNKKLKCHLLQFLFGYLRVKYVSSTKTKTDLMIYNSSTNYLIISETKLKFLPDSKTIDLLADQAV